MRSLKLTDGDFTFDNTGRLVWIQGDYVLVQAIYLRLSTLRGDLFYSENYGHPLFKGKLTKQSLENYIKETLSDDTRIKDLEIIHFEEIYGVLNRGNYRATMEITKETGEVFQMDYVI